MAPKKLSGGTYSPAEIKSLVHGYARGDISDKDMTSWLKAVYDGGMRDDEIIAVVESMISSGKRMDFSHLSRFVADKHSTGGVGDKVSLILGPLMAAAGLAIPMLSGRSLGHTGGTLDKLESIPGYRTDLSLRRFQKIVATVGVSMIGQTDEICPADKKMYALRDRTGMIKSIPLICGSIMSKKIAEGIQGLVLDIKVGNGAFMQSIDEAKALGKKLTLVGRHFGLSTDIIYSDMNQPLGRCAGLWCEMEESIHALQGDGPHDLTEVTLELGSCLLLQSGLTDSRNDAWQHLNDLIKNGEALQKLDEMVEAHGGDPSYIANSESYEKPRFSSQVVADASGFIAYMDTRQIGLTVNSLTIFQASGRRIVEPTGGVRFLKKLGNPVQAGETIALCFGKDQKRVGRAVSRLQAAIQIAEEPVRPPDLFH